MYNIFNVVSNVAKSFRKTAILPADCNTTYILVCVCWGGGGGRGVEDGIGKSFYFYFIYSYNGLENVVAGDASFYLLFRGSGVFEVGGKGRLNDTVGVGGGGP